MQLNNIKISQGCANSSNNVKNISQNNKLNLNSLFDFSQSEECNSVLISNNSYSSSDLDSIVGLNTTDEFNITKNAFAAIPSFENQVQSLIANSKENIITDLFDFDSIDTENILLNQDGSIVELQSQMLPLNILNENNNQSIEEKKEVSTKTEYNNSTPIENNNIEENLDLFIDYTILSDNSILNNIQNGNSVSEITNNLKVQNNIDLSNYKSKENTGVEKSTLQNPIDINITKDSETNQTNIPAIKENTEAEISSVLDTLKKDNFEFENVREIIKNTINNNLGKESQDTYNSKVNKNTLETNINTNTKDSILNINIANDDGDEVNVIKNNKNTEVTNSLSQSYLNGDNEIIENNSNYNKVNNQNLNSVAFEKDSYNSNFVSLNPNEKQNPILYNEINNIISEKPQNEISGELKNSKVARLNIQIENQEEIPKIEFKVSKAVDNKESNSLKNDNIQKNKTVTNENDNINQNKNSKQLQLLLSLKSNSYFPKETLSNNYVKTTNNNYSTIENLILNNFQVAKETNIQSADIPILGNINIDVENKTLQKIEKISIDEMKPNVLSEIAITKTENDSENADLNNNNSQNESNKDATLKNMNQKNNLNGIFSGVEIKQDENIFSGTKIPENNQNEDIDTEIEGKNNSNDNKIQMNKNNQEFELINSLNKIQTGGNEINNSIKKIKAEHQLNQYTAKIYTNEFAKTTFNIISSLPENSTGTANLILKPASLGIIIVNINLKDKELNIDIRPENKEVAKSIENQIPQLKERLTGVGIQLESININEGKTEQDLTEKKHTKQEQKAKQKEQEILQEYIRSFREIENEELMD